MCLFRSCELKMPMKKKTSYCSSSISQQIVNGTAILLRIAHALKMDATISCKIDNRDGVDQTHVYVGLPPNKVEDFYCISENWQNLMCTFSRSDDNPIVPNYELFYSVSTVRPQNLEVVLKSNGIKQNIVF